MGDIIKFKKNYEGLEELFNGDLSEMEIELTEEYEKKLEAVDNFIKGLPLSYEERHTLAKLLTKATNQVMEDSFMQGFRLGAHLK